MEGKADTGTDIRQALSGRMMVQDDERLEMSKSVAAQIGGDGELAYPSLDALYRAETADETLLGEGFSDRFVAGEGRVGAALMLVGEQPGDQEDRAGRPFVGPAGAVLDACLEEAGIDRAETFVTNAVKRFKFAPRGKRRMHQTPTAGDIAHYRWWLGQEVRLVNPKLVVALGGSALLALTGQRTLSPLRSHVLHWNRREILATIHPSFLLRLRDEPQRSTERERFVRDLQMAAAAVKAA